MARFDRLDVLQRVHSSGLVPIMYHDNGSVVQSVARAVTKGDARVLEFTNRGPRALTVFSELAQYLADNDIDLCLGIGSVVDEATAALFIAHNADFVVSPIFNPAIARLCNRRRIPYAPGCGTVTEISQAEEAGVEIVKMFPGGTLGGPSFIKNILGPMPRTKIMPTGGVDATRESITAWIHAGAACLGMGSKLISKDVVAARKYDVISQRVHNVLTWIQQARDTKKA